MTTDGPIATNDFQLIGPSEDGTVSDLLEGLGTKDGRQRLQALISEWLRMENPVFLLGRIGKLGRQEHGHVGEGSAPNSRRASRGASVIDAG